MSEITVGDLIKQLNGFNKNDPVCFGPNGYFSFYRVKDRSGVVQIEFNETPGVEYSLLPEHPSYRKA